MCVLRCTIFDYSLNMSVIILKDWQYVLYENRLAMTCCFFFVSEQALSINARKKRLETVTSVLLLSLCISTKTPMCAKCACSVYIIPEVDIAFKKDDSEFLSLLRFNKG